MATTTVTPEKKSPPRSSIGLKLLMAVSGLWFIFYVLVHMYGNLKMLAGQASFDNYAHHLRTMGEPLLPYTGFLWLFRLSLILAIVLHLYSALTLWGRANGARQNKYAVKKSIQASISSQWMRWGGVTLLLFIIFHLIHFTISKLNFNGDFSEDRLMVNGVESPYMLVLASFKLWWVVLIYAIAMIALGMHIHHGTWSAMQTLGWTNTASSRRVAKLAGTVLALIIVIGFLIPPFAILFGAVK